ncbi:MAG TPA: hypothetical protein VD996_06340, partial [Chitinophagaceae bacterium]|nr:hypothetical protein [Chitinophagaceae bacterium]
MRSKLYVLPAISIIVGCYLLFTSCPQKKQPPVTEINTEKAEADGPEERMLFEIERTKDPILGYVPVERLELARRIQLEKFARQQQTGRLGPVPGIGWTERGPDSVGGRSRALMFDRNDLTFRKVWAGGVGGGIWYTNDITASNITWNKVSDTFNNL